MSIQETRIFYGAWARQLQREFVDICYQYSLKLLPPILEITESTRSLGSWRAATRTIGISRHLILQYGWDITINVLKHEMAHQICSEKFENRGAPHDGEFLRACELLGLPPEYCRASIDFSTFPPHQPAGNQTTDRRKKLREKIRKLLAMADSANEHEALVALQMAGVIMKKYNLESADLETKDITYRIFRTGKKRIAAYQRTIASILSRYFEVTLICSRLYDPVADEVHKTFEIFGRSDNVEVAEHCFSFLENRLAYLWRIHREGLSDCGMNARKSYYLGVLHGFSDNCQKEDRQEGERTQVEKPCRTPALSVHQMSRENDIQVQACVQRRYPRLRTLKSPGQHVSSRIYDEGRAAGKDIVLSKVLQQEKNQKRPKLLA